MIHSIDILCRPFYAIIITHHHFGKIFLLKKCCPLLTTVVSGSPILQNGKLVGAVTHVLVNDPTRGYGIFIENMLAEAGKIK